MRKKRIMHIAQSAGGVAEYIYTLLKCMNNEKYENILICSNEYKNINKMTELNIEKYYVDMVRNIDIKKDFKAIRRIRQIVKKLKPDIIYLHSSKAGGLGRLAISKRKAKIIYNAHGWYFNAQISKKKRKIYTLIEKILAINTDKIINISKSEYESAINKKIANKNKMQIIDNAIDFEKFNNKEEDRIKIRAKYEISNDSVVIGIVGRLAEQKDPFTTLNVFKDLNQKYNNLYCMFIGDGELKEKVINYSIKEKINEKVIITNWTENVEKYLSAIDIAMLPSKWEGFGLAILEYIAAKKPIVASNVGGISNILENATFSKLIEIGDVKAYTNAIEEIINNYDEYRKKIEEEYESFKEKYSIQNFEKKHENLFDVL